MKICDWFVLALVVCRNVETRDNLTWQVLLLIFKFISLPVTNHLTESTLKDNFSILQNTEIIF